MEIKLMFNAYIITTINAFKSDKVNTLTNRAAESCKKFGTKPILFDAVVPATLENYYPGWPVREDYRERLLSNYRRKAAKEPTKEIENRMIVMQQCMTMSHYQVRKKIIENNEIPEHIDMIINATSLGINKDDKIDLDFIGYYDDVLTKEHCKFL